MIRPLMKKCEWHAAPALCLASLHVRLLAFGFKPNLEQAVSLLFASEWCFIDCFQMSLRKTVCRLFLVL